MEFWNISLFTSADGTVISIGELSFAMLVLVVGVILSRFLSHLVKRRLTSTRLDVSALAIIARVVFYVALTGVILIVLALLHIPLAALAFLSGAVAIGLGFGAQAVINNIISGWILMTSRPVRIGDFVEVDGSNGTIEDIGNRSTQIRRVDGVHLLVPNSIMLDRIVVNWTLVDRRVRSNVLVGVAYGSPVRKVESVLAQVAAEHENVLEDPPSMVYFDDFGDSALVFDLVFWCDVSAEKQLRMVRSELRYRIDELFRDSGIVIAFPQRDVHVDVGGPIKVTMAPSEDVN